jgi:hypothetical protein
LSLTRKRVGRSALDVRLTRSQEVPPIQPARAKSPIAQHRIVNQTEFQNIATLFENHPNLPMSTQLENLSSSQTAIETGNNQEPISNVKIPNQDFNRFLSSLSLCESWRLRAFASAPNDPRNIKTCNNQNSRIFPDLL